MHGVFVRKMREFVAIERDFRVSDVLCVGFVCSSGTHIACFVYSNRFRVFGCGVGFNVCLFSSNCERRRNVIAFFGQVWLKVFAFGPPAEIFIGICCGGVSNVE